VTNGKEEGDFVLYGLHGAAEVAINKDVTFSLNRLLRDDSLPDQFYLWV